jgi:hypothetical protein
MDRPFGVIQAGKCHDDDSQHHFCPAAVSLLVVRSTGQQIGIPAGNALFGA